MRSAATPPRRRSPLSVSVVISFPPGIGHSHGAGRDRHADGGPEVRAGSYFESCANQLGAFTHELQPEVAAAADGRIVGLEALAIVADLDRPAARVAAHSDTDVARLGVLANILECLLDHPQCHDLDGLWQCVDPLIQVDVDRDVQGGRDLVGGFVDRAGQAQVREQRRAELAEVGADASQLPREDLSELAELLAGEPLVAVEQALDDLDLEDGVAERLGRPVVDLASEPGALGLLGLDDAHLGIGGARRAGWIGDERGVLAGEEQPGVLEGADGEVDATEGRALLADLAPDDELVRRGLVLAGATLARLGGARTGDGAEPLPALDAVEVRLAVALADVAEGVGALGDGRLGLVEEGREGVVVDEGRGGVRGRRRGGGIPGGRGSRRGGRGSRRGGRGGLRAAALR